MTGSRTFIFFDMETKKPLRKLSKLEAPERFRELMVKEGFPVELVEMLQKHFNSNLTNHRLDSFVDAFTKGMTTPVLYPSKTADIGLIFRHVEIYKSEERESDGKKYSVFLKDKNGDLIVADDKVSVGTVNRLARVEDLLHGFIRNLDSKNPLNPVSFKSLDSNPELFSQTVEILNKYGVCGPIEYKTPGQNEAPEFKVLSYDGNAVYARNLRDVVSNWDMYMRMKANSRDNSLQICGAYLPSDQKVLDNMAACYKAYTPVRFSDGMTIMYDLDSGMASPVTNENLLRDMMSPGFTLVPKASLYYSAGVTAEVSSERRSDVQETKKPETKRTSRTAAVQEPEVTVKKGPRKL